MTEHKLPHGWIAHIPDYYEPIPLKGHTEWVAALESGQYDKGVDWLCKEHFADPRIKAYCCLGVKCALQGRLVKKDPQSSEWSDNGGSHASMVADNPDNAALGELGFFPDSVCLRSPKGTSYIALSGVNDITDTFEVVIAIIKLLWKEK